MWKKRASNHNTSVSSFSVTKAATQNPITHKTQEQEQIQPREEECGVVGWRRRRRRAKETRKEERRVRRQTMVRGRAGRKKGCDEGRGAKQQASSKSKEAGAGEGSKRGSGRERHGNKRTSGKGASWERVPARFGPFFCVCPQDPTWNNNTLSAQPPKKLFSKNSSLGQSHHRILFSQKAQSVSNSYFYSSEVFLSEYVYGSLYVIYIRVLLGPYALPNSQNSPFGQFQECPTISRKSKFRCRTCRFEYTFFFKNKKLTGLYVYYTFQVRISKNTSFGQPEHCFSYLSLVKM
jgi:hypothetical protein